MNLIARPPARAPSSPAVTGSDRSLGIALAGLTALISGVSVFVNGYGVRRFDDATTYTTAKNLIAAAVITSVFVVARRSKASVPRSTASSAQLLGPRQRTLALVAVAVVGGSVPFVLFFEGLQRASSTDAAFIHKTLVVWVAVLAATLLRERIGPVQILAFALLLWGQAALTGGVGLPEMGLGEVLILAATLCWAVEVVISRRALVGGVDEFVLGTVRMAGGVSLLLVWAVARGAVADLFALRIDQWGWVLLTGAFLAAYVISWHLALARAQAVDVTAVLVAGAIVTALLNSGIRDVPVRPVALVLLGVGAMLTVVGALRPTRPLAAS